MSFNTPWPRVYPGISKLPRDEMRRLTIEIPAEDANVLMSVAVNPAIFSLICQASIKFFTDHARSNAFTYANADDLVAYICERTNHRAVTSSPSHPLPGGSKSVHAGTSHPSNLPTSVGEEVTSGRGGKGSKGTSGKGK